MSNQPTTDQPTAGPGSEGDLGPGDSQRRPLRRRQEGRLLAGVAAGVADHLGIDVVIVRILFVLTTVFTNGLGLIAYVLGWIFIPSDEGASAPARPTRSGDGGLRRDPLFWVGIGLLIVGAIWLFNAPFRPGVWFPFGAGPLRVDGGLIFALLLIGLGVALWRSGERRPADTAPASAHPPAPTVASPTAPARPDIPSLETPVTRDLRTPDAVAAGEDPPAGAPTEELPSTAGPAAGPEAGPPPGAEPPSGPPPTDPAGQAAGWTPPPVPERRRSVLGQITLGLALVTAGVLWALRISGAAPIGIGRIAAATLLVVAIGLLVGSFVGRARWLIVVGVLLLPLVLVAELLRPIGFADLPSDMVRGPFGEVRTQPATLEELEPSYQLGAGSLDLDLSQLAFEDATRISIQVGAGEVRVRIPDDVDIEVVTRAGAGEMRVLGRSATGVGLERRIIDEVDEPAASLELDVQVGLGSISVTRAPTPAAARAPAPPALVPAA